jgi:predicted transcriptional regulator
MSNIEQEVSASADQVAAGGTVSQVLIRDNQIKFEINIGGVDTHHLVAAGCLKVLVTIGRGQE